MHSLNDGQLISWDNLKYFIPNFVISLYYIEKYSDRCFLSLWMDAWGCILVRLRLWYYFLSWLETYLILMLQDWAISFCRITLLQYHQLYNSLPHNHLNLTQRQISHHTPISAHHDIFPIPITSIYKIFTFNYTKVEFLLSLFVSFC